MVHLQPGADTAENSDRKTTHVVNTMAANTLQNTTTTANALTATTPAAGSAISAAILQELRRQHDAILLKYGPAAAAAHVREASMRLQSQASVLQIRQAGLVHNQLPSAAAAAAALNLNLPQNQPALTVTATNNNHAANNSDGNNSIATDTSSVTDCATQPAVNATTTTNALSAIPINSTAAALANPTAGAAVPQVLVQLVPMAGGGYAALPIQQPVQPNMLLVPPTTATATGTGGAATAQTTTAATTKESTKKDAIDLLDVSKQVKGKRTSKEVDRREPASPPEKKKKETHSSKRSRAQRDEALSQEDEDSERRRSRAHRDYHDYSSYDHEYHRQSSSHPPSSKQPRTSSSRDDRSSNYHHGQHPGESHQEQLDGSSHHRHPHHGTTDTPTNRERHAKPGMERFLSKVFLGEEGYTANLLRDENVVLSKKQLVYLENVVKDARRREAGESGGPSSRKQQSIREYELRKELQRVKLGFSEQASELCQQIDRLTAERDQAEEGRRKAVEEVRVAKQDLHDSLAKKKKEYECALRAYMKSSVHSLQQQQRRMEEEYRSS